MARKDRVKGSPPEVHPNNGTQIYTETLVDGTGATYQVRITINLKQLGLWVNACIVPGKKSINIGRGLFTLTVGRLVDIGYVEQQAPPSA